MRRLILAFLLLLIPAICRAYTVQVINSGGPIGTAMTANATTFYPLVLPGTVAGAAAATSTKIAFPTAGVLYGLSVTLSGAAGAGQSWTFYLYKGSAVTALTCQVAGASATSCYDASGVQRNSAHAISVAQGDLFCYEVVGSATATVQHVTFTLLFSPTVAGQTVLINSSNGHITRSAQWDSLFGTGSPTQDRNFILTPTAGVISNFCAWESVLPTNPATETITLEYGAPPSSVSATNLTVTLTSATANYVCDNTAGHNVTVTAGNALDIIVAVSGTQPDTGWSESAVFTPTVPGQFILGMSNATGSLAGGTLYGIASARAASSGTWSATETTSNVQGMSSPLGNPIQFKAIYAFTRVTPGSGKSYDFTLRMGGSSTALTVNYPNGTAGAVVSASINVLVRTLSLIDIMSVPNGGPAAQGTASISFLCYIPPIRSDFFRVIK
jgi:hypothetical protein